MVEGTEYKTRYQNHDQFSNPRTIVEEGNVSRTTTATFSHLEDIWRISLPSEVEVDGVKSSEYQYTADGLLESEEHFGVLTDYEYFDNGDLRAYRL